MHTREELLKKSNRQANRYNIYAMIVILILLVICEVLNELDIFLVPKMSMRPTVGAIAGLFLIPVLIYYIHDKWLKKEPTILEWDGFKIIIIIISYIGVLLAAVVLSFHATLLLTVPPIMAAQYRNKKKLIIVVLIATIISVPLAIYGSYFFGLVDKNLILVEVEDVIDIDVQKRFESATAERMFVILYHHILPRWICIILIDVLVVAIAQRNARMLDDQMGLSDQVKHEMERRTQMQNRVIGDLACCQFVYDLPNKLNTVIGEGGSTLSGGELQRLSIARAILKDSKIVILDEATANVDPENEEKLIKAIDALTKNKTVIMIAHRLKTVRNCDNIYVIDDGKIVESGKHDELMKIDGIYKSFIIDRKEAVGWKI